MTENVIETDCIKKVFGSNTAVDSVSLTIKKGELFGLLGPNGAGKTTLLKLLTGQLEASEGHAVVLGLNPSKDFMEVKRRIGIVPEVESPPSFLTGIEYLQYIGLVREMDNIDAKANKWIEFLDMKDMQDTPAKDLSKGTKQKLMIAAAFIHRPPLVFLDEPFAGLDPFYQKQVKEHIQQYLKEGGTVFMCTHILEIAEKMCTRIAIINKGKIAAQGTVKEIEGSGETLDAAFMRYTGKQ